MLAKIGKLWYNQDKSRKCHMPWLRVPPGEDPAGRDSFRLAALLPQVPGSCARKYPQKQCLRWPELRTQNASRPWPFLFFGGFHGRL